MGRTEMERMKKTGAVIAAAGLSSRMGAFKPLLPLGDTTIIGQGIRTLRQAGALPIVAVTGRESQRLTAYLEELGVICVYNSRYETTDMFASLCLGMRRLKGEADRFFFLPGDIPLFRRETLLALQQAMDQTGCDLVQPVWDGRGGHPVLIRSDQIPALLDWQGEGGLRGAMEDIIIKKKQLPVQDPGIRLDADTREDYKRLLRLAEESAGGNTGTR